MKANHISNYVIISDRTTWSYGAGWAFGFGYNEIGYNVFGAGVSTSAREEHNYIEDSSINEVYEISIDGTE